MKILLTCFIAVFLALPAVFAESLEPEEVVRSLIRAAQENNLKTVLDTADLIKIASFPRHSRTPEDLIEFLKGINLKKIQFKKMKRKGWPMSTRVRMIAPLSIDFDLELIMGTIEKQEDHYKVIAVHP